MEVPHRTWSLVRTSVLRRTQIRVRAGGFKLGHEQVDAFASRRARRGKPLHQQPALLQVENAATQSSLRGRTTCEVDDDVLSTESTEVQVQHVDVVADLDEGDVGRSVNLGAKRCEVVGTS